MIYFFFLRCLKTILTALWESPTYTNNAEIAGNVDRFVNVVVFLRFRSRRPSRSRAALLAAPRRGDGGPSQHFARPRRPRPPSAPAAVVRADSRSRPRRQAATRGPCTRRKRDQERRSSTAKPSLDDDEGTTGGVPMTAAYKCGTRRTASCRVYG